MTYFINRNIKNNEFELAYKSDFFVDKTELIDKINKSVNVKERFLCITRPRRFGKTINAMMLETYYSKNINSKGIFDKLNISKCDSYEKHLNKHNVIYITFKALKDYTDLKLAIGISYDSKNKKHDILISTF